MEIEVVAEIRTKDARPTSGGGDQPSGEAEASVMGFSSRERPATEQWQIICAEVRRRAGGAAKRAGDAAGWMCTMSSSDPKVAPISIWTDWSRCAPPATIRPTRPWPLAA